jgi:multidrug transporter EmrE-like cation transporter
MNILSLFQTWPVIVFYGTSLVFVLMGDYFAKAWSIEHSILNFTLASLGYFLSGAVYLPILLRQSLVVSATIWMILNIVGFVVIGMILYKESVNLWQAIGIGFGIISIVFLSISGE